jgi:tetratricopeptide (TPR) repeat protein
VTQDFARTCFVVMPFGRKAVGDRELDFDRLYETLILPAVAASRMPDSTRVEALRADREFFSAAINVEMFRALEYARIALVDITGLNANVFYELGARHRARESGTVIIRKEGESIPFDINTIRVFSYNADDERQVSESTDLIARVLTETLQQQRPDSPVQLALDVQRDRPELQAMLAEAENQLRVGDRSRAAALLLQAAEKDPGNPAVRLRAAVLLRDEGQFPDVIAQANLAANLAPTYAEAHRELGIGQNKLHTRSPAEYPDTGELALRRAIELNPHDYETLCNLGGIYKRQRRYPEALENYEAALALSNAHPYPLLNSLKLRFAIDPHDAVNSRDRVLLGRARVFRDSQARQNPPLDTPWCFFDLSDIALFLGEHENLIDQLTAGIDRTSHRWQITTHADSLELLPATFPSLRPALAMLRAAEAALNFG